LGLHPKETLENNMDNAVNHTLRRTLNTSLSVIVVLLAIIIFGGASIRGFAVAMLIGCISGVYSTVFVATPISYDVQRLC
jgi:SecD/SecF fusion protein